MNLTATVKAASPAIVRAAGMYTVYGAAVLASLSTLYELALRYAGWTTGFALLFAVTLDIYWLTALHMAMDKSLGVKQRVQAALHAFTAIAVSVTGNVIFHELHAGMWTLGRGSGALVTAVMASVPLLAAAALTHLRSLERTTVPAGEEQPRARRTRTAAGPPRVTVPAPHEETAPSRDDDGTVPHELTAGGRPHPVALAKARELLATGQLYSRRTLTAAVNDFYGFTAIGETAAARVIEEHRRTA